MPRKITKRDRLMAYLKQLRMRARFEALAETARRENRGYEAYLLALCDAECEARRHSRIERNLIVVKGKE